MSDEAGDTVPYLPEAVARVQTISDPKALKRHLLKMFEQGKPRYADFFDADAEPWNLLPEMVEDLADGWEPIVGDRARRPVIAMALTLSMPAGTDPFINEAAALAMARTEFSGHQRIWVSGDHEGPYVKFLVEYRDEENRPLSSGPADLRRFREAYAHELSARGVMAQATTRGSRGLGFSEKRKAYKTHQRINKGNA